MVKHPEELGFKLGLKIRIGRPALIVQSTPDASTVRDVVYVALLDENRLLEEKDALKVGQAKGTLLSRWRRLIGIFQRDNLRKNEMEDRRKWLEVANGKEVSVWMKSAGRIELPYAKGLTQSLFSSRGAEEEFLDRYYQPRLGMSLNREATEETS
ncbi:MAG TPA: hypothetical protein VNU20_03745 [Candidatus Sulfotelmatobacter sp.]|jgi:hypothetical protein|nr:hypothetical protein [Candidatus Sulfotelmatobacter sp.]